LLQHAATVVKHQLTDNIALLHCFML